MRPISTPFAAVLGLTAALNAATANAEMPAFEAACPQGHRVEADAAGVVRVDGAEARVEMFNANYYEARHDGITYTISTAPAGSDLQVGYNPPGSAGGYCTILTAVAGGASEVQVRFQPGAFSADMAGSLAPGESRRYVLGARDGQELKVRVEHRGGPRLDYQIFNPDGSFLLDMISTDNVYSGQLWQSGEHVVEVVNRGGATADYDVLFEIR